MKYRYYIYKQAVGVGFDKYDLGGYTLIREIAQNSEWGLKIERDNEFFTVIRSKFNGEITIKGDDFNALIALEETHIQYAVVIHRECAGVYAEFWKGFFSYFDFKVDLDKCYLTFQPEPWDIYARVFDELPVERNILATSDGESVLINSYQWNYEDIISRRTVVYGGAPTWDEYAFEPIVYPPGNMYYLYSRTYYTSTIPHIYYRVEEYRRDWALNDSNTVTPPGTNWVLDPQLPGPGEYSPGIWKYVRPYQNATSGTYIGYQALPEIYAGFIQDINLSPTEAINGCITLHSILDYFAGHIELSYVSNFFNDDPCPIGGTSLSLTMLTQITNIRETAELASRGMMTLRDLLTWIRDTFNAYWYIDSNGDFRIEHRKYFDFGRSYTTIAGIELDVRATYPVETLKMNRYEYIKPKLFRFEKLEFTYEYFDNWRWRSGSNHSKKSFELCLD